MNTVMKFPVKASTKAKAEIKAAIEKGQTKAKNATTPASKQKIAAKIKEAMKQKASLQSPTIFARCVKEVGGDLAAAALLSAISVKWHRINKKLEWQGREWLAMPAAEWALTAGLSENQFNKRALSRVRSYCANYVEIRQKKLKAKEAENAVKMLWICLDVAGFAEAMNEAGYEIKAAQSNGFDPY